MPIKPTDLTFAKVGDEGCPSIYRLKRGNFVKVKGHPMQVRQVTKVQRDKMWHEPYTGESHLASRNRASQEATGRIAKTGARAGQRWQAERGSVKDVTHVAVRGGTRRRRRRY